MPYGEPDPEDPTELRGIRLPAADDSSMHEMATSFVQEFFRMGYSADRVMALFKNPHYAASHKAAQVLGEDTIKEIIQTYSQLYRKREIA